MTEPKRVLVVHLYRSTALAPILTRLKADKRPPETELFVGSYGIRPADAKLISAIPGAHYAPTFHLGPKVNRRIRSGRLDLPKNTPLFDKAFAGPFPADPNVPWLPREKPRAWGFEIGRRFRDQLRAAHKKQPLIANWQLDEIPREGGNGTHAHARRADFRLFVGGVIRGIAEGRPRFHDELLQGFVWISAEALETLPALPVVRDVKIFWEDVDVGARYLVGEEYPKFLRGTASSAANLLARPQTVLAKSGSGPRRELAKRYVVGMTPGWHKPETSGLNGNVGGMQLPGVAAFRKEFIKARTKAQRPCGYGMFHFDGDFNTVPERLNEAIGALNFAAKTHATP
jgi:hypothetical protein